MIRVHWPCSSESLTLMAITNWTPTRCTSYWSSSARIFTKVVYRAYVIPHCLGSQDAQLCWRGPTEFIVHIRTIQVVLRVPGKPTQARHLEGKIQSLSSYKISQRCHQQEIGNSHCSWGQAYGFRLSFPRRYWDYSRTRESSLQQFHPCIGRKNPQGRIQTLYKNCVRAELQLESKIAGGEIQETSNKPVRSDEIKRSGICLNTRLHPHYHQRLRHQVEHICDHLQPSFDWVRHDCGRLCRPSAGQ